MGPTEWSRWNVSLRLAVAVTTVDFSANYFVLGELATAAGLSSLSLVAGPAPKIPYALETDSPVEDAAEIEPVCTSNSQLTGKLTRNFADSGPPAQISRPVGEREFNIQKCMPRHIIRRTSQSHLRLSIAHHSANEMELSTRMTQLPSIHDQRLDRNAGSRLRFNS